MIGKLCSETFHFNAKESARHENHKKQGMKITTKNHRKQDEKNYNIQLCRIHMVEGISNACDSRYELDITIIEPDLLLSI